MNKRILLLVLFIALILSAAAFGLTFKDMNKPVQQSIKERLAYLSSPSEGKVVFNKFKSARPLNLSVSKTNNNNLIYLTSGLTALNVFKSADAQNWDNTSVVVLTDDSTRKIFKSSMVKGGDKYYLYYENSNYSLDSNGNIISPDFKLYRAESTDAEKWSNFVKVSDLSVSNPSVIYKDGKYHLFYYREDTSEKYLYYSTSEDGLNFKLENSEKPVNIGITNFDVAWSKDMNTFVLTYTSDSLNDGRLYYLFSKDGLNWKYNITKTNANNSIDTSSNIQGGVAILRDEDGSITGKDLTIAYVKKNSTASDDVSIASKSANILEDDSDTGNFKTVDPDLVKSITGNTTTLGSLILGLFSILGILVLLVRRR